MACSREEERKVSRHPGRPQAQTGPLGSMVMCPISPAVKACPSTTSSLTQSAAPTPCPMRTSSELGEPSPKNRSAISAIRVELLTDTGSPSASSRRARSGRWDQPRCTALSTVPSESTMPGKATPTPSVGRSDMERRRLIKAMTSSIVMALVVSTVLSTRWTMRPHRSTSAPLMTKDCVRSMAMTRQYAVSMARTVERLPRPVRLSMPVSRMMRWSVISSVTLLMAIRDSPMCRLSSTRDICVAGNSRLKTAIVLLARISDGTVFVAMLVKEASLMGRSDAKCSMKSSRQRLKRRFSMMPIPIVSSLRAGMRRELLFRVLCAANRLVDRLQLMNIAW